MVRIILALNDPVLRERFDSALTPNVATNHGWRIERAQSFQKIVELAVGRPSAVAVIEFQRPVDSLTADLRKLRRAAPACFICMAASAPGLLLQDARPLITCGVNRFFGERDFADPKRAVVTILDVCRDLSVYRVLGLLRSRLVGGGLEAVEVILKALTVSVAEEPRPDQSSRIKAARDKLGSHPAVPAERFDIAVRLLALIDLVENCQRTVSVFATLCGFPSAKDAGEMLRTYSGVQARELGAGTGRDHARARIIQVLLGQRLPERRRNPEEQRAIEQSSNRAIEQSSNRAIEQSSNRAIEQSSATHARLIRSAGTYIVRRSSRVSARGRKHQGPRPRDESTDAGNRKNTATSRNSLSRFSSSAGVVRVCQRTSHTGPENTDLAALRVSRSRTGASNYLRRDCHGLSVQR